ncbi:HAD-IIIC family phosphatase [Streptomyces aculeolatus]|uniref:HAD-IIIC family phosphatase n=1 Tax=Streptomyces aculeolatus TaxID=270689 RepID=UPI001CEDBB64|nr:HAD-IIIC family phosphatase [Streptomyces aculeolatus]
MTERELYVKCLVWDLDGTVWDGTLLEDRDVRLRPGVRDTLRALDERGIVHSVASHNDEADALAELAGLGLAEYFLRPRIGWSAKSVLLDQVAERLRLSPGALAYVDDRAYQLDEVRSARPEIRCYPADAVPRLPGLAEFSPPVTEAAAGRRRAYLDQHRREDDEEAFTGPRHEFLAGLGTVLTVARAGDADLARAEELTVRTHQLNTTGRTYSRAELAALRGSPDHLLLMASLRDRYGDSGQVGLVLLHTGPEVWTLRLLLLSCRVLGRGIGEALLAHVLRLARRAGAATRAEFVPNDRNRVMHVALRFAGFAPVGGTLLEHRGEPPAVPGHLTLREVPA